MTLLSQSAFATHKNVNRSTVTRWKDDGRLVMVGNKVDVEASEQRLKETAGGRDDVAARHAAAKGQVTAPEIEPFNEKRADAQARKESAQADIAEMERDKLLGKLVEKEAVDSIVADVFITFRQSLEGLKHRAGSRLVMKDHDTVQAVLKEEVFNMLASMERDFAEQLKELVEGAHAD